MGKPAAAACATDLSGRRSALLHSSENGCLRAQQSSEDQAAAQGSDCVTSARTRSHVGCRRKPGNAKAGGASGFEAGGGPASAEPGVIEFGDAFGSHLSYSTRAGRAEGFRWSACSSAGCEWPYESTWWTVAGRRCAARRSGGVRWPAKPAGTRRACSGASTFGARCWAQSGKSRRVGSGGRTSAAVAGTRFTGRVGNGPASTRFRSVRSRRSAAIG
jgi:hypothetical protein